MSDNPSYGHWHDLHVYETLLINLGNGPEPPDESERLVHTLTHPAQCGRACNACGTHPHCDIEYQVNEAGPEVYGDLEPGHYKARTWYHRTPGGPWGGPEYDVGVEVVAIEDFDAEGAEVPA